MGDAVLTEEVEEVTDLQDGPSDESASLNLLSSLGALLFVSSKPLSVKKLSKALSRSEKSVEEGLRELQERFVEEIHGFSLQEVGNGWQFRTTPEAASAIRKLYPVKERRLSKAAAETLAVIAYKQPVPRAEIEAIRGVDALPTIKTLLDAKLIRIIGREEAVGQPALYGTTSQFLERFGLNSLNDLPSMREMDQYILEPGEASVHEEEEEEVIDD